MFSKIGPNFMKFGYFFYILGTFSSKNYSKSFFSLWRSDLHIFTRKARYSVFKPHSNPYITRSDITRNRIDAVWI